MAEEAVGGRDGRLVSMLGQPLAGRLDQLDVAVDGGDAVRAEALAEQGGVVAAAGGGSVTRAPIKAGRWPARVGSRSLESPT
jgi:N-acetylglucosamine kinase-like BadF-type ATPase